MWKVYGVLGCLIFSLFIVYDTQQIKQKYVLRVKFKFQQRY